MMTMTLFLFSVWLGALLERYCYRNRTRLRFWMTGRYL